MAKPALGKGFDALINQNLSRESLAAPQAGDVVHQLSHAAIIPSSLQPRAIFTPEQLAELVDSIKEHGIIQPLIVRKTQSDKYELIAGERRWRASGILGLSTVPAIIREASDKDVLELALIENLQRENLSPLEEAAGYMRLKTEFRMKQGDIAKRVGKSRAAVANSMRLLDLPQPVQDMLGNTFISVGHAKVLLSLKNKDQQIQLGRDIVNKGYTVRQTEKAIQKMLNPPEPAPVKSLSTYTFGQYVEDRAGVLSKKTMKAVCLYNANWDRMAGSILAVVTLGDKEETGSAEDLAWDWAETLQLGENDAILVINATNQDYSVVASGRFFDLLDAQSASFVDTLLEESIHKRDYDQAVLNLFGGLHQLFGMYQTDSYAGGAGMEVFRD